MGYYAMTTGKYRVSFFFRLTLAALRRTPRVGEVEQSVTGARQTIAVPITCRKTNKNSLERLAGVCWSSRKKTPYSSRRFGKIIVSSVDHSTRYDIPEDLNLQVVLLFHSDILVVFSTGILLLLTNRNACETAYS